MNIIISPHPDDELIGCYSLIKQGLIDTVIYIDAEPDRLVEANLFGENLGFKVEELDFKYLYNHLEYPELSTLMGEDPTVFVPDSSDNHPLHKAINGVARMSGCK